MQPKRRERDRPGEEGQGPADAETTRCQRSADLEPLPPPAAITVSAPSSAGQIHSAGSPTHWRAGEGERRACWEKRPPCSGSRTVWLCAGAPVD